MILTGSSDNAEPDRSGRVDQVKAEGETKAEDQTKAEEETPRDDQGAAVRLPASSCPPASSNCVVARGRVIYVEAVDPDGDGDAHFVTVSEQGVTLPGITIFDVRADLRPDPLPGVGDLVGGAGPVYRGHAGQKQIQVDEFHVAR